ncbi:MAG: LacI family DNA-binding transcriptional regulator, partial [Pseudomonadota bacterium]|nr:LacI family DNA-binding transcriptional regulator [Pseudomonadota bacterium]
MRVSQGRECSKLLIDLFTDFSKVNPSNERIRMAPVPKISEIARLAGVGTATVDRVLNRRAGVNAETVQRVLQVVEELGSPRQPGRPRKGENFRFVYVLPADEFAQLGLIDRQIAQSAGDFRHQHITEVTCRIDASDPTAFADELSKLRDCHGIALLAPDLPPIKLAINELTRMGIHVVTLFSDVAGSLRETHIGPDNRAAGRTAGLLLARFCRSAGKLAVVWGGQLYRSHEERESGFRSILRSERAD